MATLYNQYIYKNGAWMKIGTSSDSVTYTLSYSALTGLLTLTGSDGSTSTVTIDSGSSDAITGITVNGTTVTVTDGVAAISIPTNVSAFTNDAGYITTHQDISGKVDTQHTFSEGTGAIQYNSEEEAIYLYREGNVGVSSVELYTSGVGLYWSDNDYSNYGSSLSVGSSGITISSTAISGVEIHNVATPTNATDAVNKQYVDNLISTNTPAQASINSTGLITYKNSGGSSLFTLQLPLYNGGVS